LLAISKEGGIQIQVLLIGEIRPQSSWLHKLPTVNLTWHLLKHLGRSSTIF